MNYISSIFEFYEGLRSLPSKEIIEVLNIFKNQNNFPLGIIQTSKDITSLCDVVKFDNSFSSKKRDEICYDIERIVKGKFAREQKRAFYSIYDVPSFSEDRHDFYKICEIHPKKDFLIEPLGIYKCDFCSTIIYECDECGYILGEIEMNINEKGEEAYYCKNCDGELGNSLVQLDSFFEED